MSRLLSFFLLFFLLISTSLFAQQKATATVTVDRSKILIGEPVTIRLQANFKNIASAEFFKLDSIPHFEVLEKFSIDTQRNSTNVLLTQRIIVTSWDSGKWQIPSFTLSGSRQKTKPVSVEVVYSSFNPEQDYHDIKDIITVKKEAPVRWYWYVVGAILLALLFVLLFPGRKKPVVAEVTDANAYKTAVKDLQTLKTKGFEKDGKEYYTELVLIFRKYLNQKKGIISHSKTTADLREPLKMLKLPSSYYTDLLQTLELSDAVKFARVQPTKEEGLKALDIIKKSIDSIEKE